MLRLTGAERGDTRARRVPPGPLRAGLVSITCLLRGVPLFFSAAPRTPLRVLCIVALDTIHVLRHSQSLSRQRRQELATFLDFQACTNAVWDRKPLCAEEYQAQRQRLEKAGLGPWIAEFVVRLRELETRRPPAGGDRRCFDAVRSYREAVARLSLATITAIALNAKGVDEGIRATHGDGDVAALFRMAMQCQIIDDVVDYEEDLSAGLPSFLTASASLLQALSWTAEAARSYALVPGHSAGPSVLPVRVALHLVTTVTKLVIAVAGRGESRVSGG
ncbi:MAG TPA: hypothetical protein VFO58_19890 [Vicinamibacterales bacterium]|nr:hypothetical protein [Vicinamibacterales bacterium]